MRKLYQATELENRRVILSLLEPDEHAKVLDLGCSDGSFTLELGKRIGTDKLYGVDVIDDFIPRCETNGIKAYHGDLNDPLPLDDESFDIVHSNQVLEHLHQTDLFVKEIYRVLKHGGYTVISTPNLAALHNIAFLILGHQPATAYVSDELYDVGNPFGTRHGLKRDGRRPGHLRIPTRSALRELFQYHGFGVEKVVGVGYYPFTASIARLLSRLDPWHSAYLTMKARKL